VIIQSIRKSAVGLGIFAVFTAGIIAFTQSSTQEAIATNQKEAQARALYEVMPRETHDNDLVSDQIERVAPSLVGKDAIARIHIARLKHEVSLVGKDAIARIHIARLKHEVIAVILPAVTENGYNGRIKSLVGINADGTVAAVRIVEHKETPGLGDKIEVKKSDWVHQFSGLSLLDPPEEKWTVQKDGGYFDQMTGATITPRAVVRSVRSALEYFALNQSDLLQDTDEAAKEDGSNDGAEDRE